MGQGQQQRKPKPLDSNRILHMIAAPPGTKAWFDVPVPVTGATDGSMTTVAKSQPVLFFAAVEFETESEDDKKQTVRVQNCVPVICGGAAGLVVATEEDHYLCTTTGDETYPPERHVAQDEEGDDEETSEQDA